MDYQIIGEKIQAQMEENGEHNNIKIFLKKQ